MNDDTNNYRKNWYNSSSVVVPNGSGEVTDIRMTYFYGTVESVLF